MRLDKKNLAWIVCPSAWLLLAVCLLVGCKHEDRVSLSGTVTWKGQSVPAGMVFFSPDIKAGNKMGPQGIASIVNGRYDTRGKDGRPVVSGPQRVTVQGFDGSAGDEEHPLGKRLFMPSEISVIAPQESGTLDLVVPESAKALR